MTANSVGFPPHLHACVNEFLSQVNDMRAKTPYDDICASLMYAAARINAHGFLARDSAQDFNRAEFVGYMANLYKRMLEEQLEVLAKAAAAGPAAADAAE
jgi:hypothetical protein